MRDVWCPCVSASRRVGCTRVSCPGLRFVGHVSGVVCPLRPVSSGRAGSELAIHNEVLVLRYWDWYWSYVLIDT